MTTPHMDGNTDYGFHWGPMRVERLAELPDGRHVLRIRTNHGDMKIYVGYSHRIVIVNAVASIETYAYVSRMGRNIRIFDKNSAEWGPKP